MNRSVRWLLAAVAAAALSPLLWRGAARRAERLDREATRLHDLKRYTEEVALRDELVWLRFWRPEEFSRRGWARLSAGAYRAALKDFDRCLRRDPGAVDAHLGRALTLENLGRWRESRAENRNAVEAADAGLAAQSSDINRVSVLDWRGWAKVNRGEYAAAILDFDAVLRLDPKVPTAFRGRAEALTGLGRFAEALADYDRSLAIEPVHTDARIHRALLRAQAGDGPGFRQDLEQAGLLLSRRIRENPGDARAYSRRGYVRSLLGEETAALADLDRALALNPRRDEPYLQRSVVRGKLGDYAGAQQDMRSARERTLAAGKQATLRLEESLERLWVALLERKVEAAAVPRLPEPDAENVRAGLQRLQQDFIRIHD